MKVDKEEDSPQAYSSPKEDTEEREEEVAEKQLLEEDILMKGEERIIVQLARSETLETMIKVDLLNGKLMECAAVVDTGSVLTFLSLESVQTCAPALLKRMEAYAVRIGLGLLGNLFPQSFGLNLKCSGHLLRLCPSWPQSQQSPTGLGGSSSLSLLRSSSLSGAFVNSGAFPFGLSTHLARLVSPYSSSVSKIAHHLFT
jgi:hypothetical protein